MFLCTLYRDGFLCSLRLHHKFIHRLQTIEKLSSNLYRPSIPLLITAKDNIPYTYILYTLIGAICHSNQCIRMQTRNTSLRKRLYKALYRIQCYIGSDSRELPVLLYTCTSGADSSVCFTGNGTSDNKLIIRIRLGKNVLCNYSTCFVSFPGIQQDRPQVLSIIGLYRNSCICGSAVLHAYRSIMSGIGGLF